MAYGYHHWHQRQHKSHSNGNEMHSAKTKRMLDGFIYAASFLSIAANLPQLIEIWINHNSAGVSLISWGAFFLSSLFWIFYGFVHRSKSIMFLNTTLAFMQLFIVVGIIIKP